MEDIEARASIYSNKRESPSKVLEIRQDELQKVLNTSLLNSFRCSDVKITDLKCISIEGFPTIRIDSDEGISGFSQIEYFKNEFIIPNVLIYRSSLLDMDPRNVERVMLRIRHLGGFKPWGAAISAIEMALWDLAGKTEGVPVHQLLGGKIRDKVRVYHSGGASPFTDPPKRLPRNTPEDFAQDVRMRKALPEKFSLVKTGFPLDQLIKDGYMYGEIETTGLPLPPWPGYGMPFPDEFRGQIGDANSAPGYINQQITGAGVKHIVECVKAMKEVLGEEVALATHIPRGSSPQGLLTIAKALEPYDVAWLEDALSGDYYPYTLVEEYRMVSDNTSTPIHTGEQIYLRQGCRGLIENHAIDVLGIDPCDVGGIAETKWIGEYADLYGITMAPHGVGNGIFGTAAMVHMAACMPKNYIAFELPIVTKVWWELVKLNGYPCNYVRDGYIEVPDTPGVGVELVEKAVRKHVSEKDADYFFTMKGK